MVSKEEKIVTEDMLANLPEPVQRYMHFSGVIGRPWIEAVVLEQEGGFRQGADRSWMPMTARQTYTVDPPSFVWEARFKIAGLPLLRARDEYRHGRGHMSARLAGLYNVLDVRGEKLDQGAMLRYLSEMIWFPVAFLGDNITWQAVDDSSADVRLEDAGKSVTGRMHFDSQGRPTNFTAMRYREVDGDFSLDPWSTPMTGYGRLGGLNLPVEARAVWNLPGGDLEYVNLRITKIEYNAPI
ncbi:MAG: DUF6544 family protein [Anaerolineales bacterium]|nr:DUF6544 family protein [Anaerolineales bacterium]